MGWFYDKKNIFFSGRLNAAYIFYTGHLNTGNWSKLDLDFYDERMICPQVRYSDALYTIQLQHTFFCFAL